jgi:hypothetical protein
MSLVAKQPEGGGDFEILPEGQYTARCFKVIDLGTQELDYMGEIKFLPKIMVTWEILDDKVKMADGRPFAISKQYTLSLHEKSNLYKDLVAWRGKSFTKEELLGFDISKLLGAYCQIQVVHNDSKDGTRTYANVNTIMGTKDRPKGVNPEMMFDIANSDMDVFDTLSEWLQTKIRSSEEWKANQLSQEPVQDKTIDPKDIDINKDIKIEDLGDEEEPIDLNEIPF